MASFLDFFKRYQADVTTERETALKRLDWIREFRRKDVQGMEGEVGATGADGTVNGEVPVGVVPTDLPTVSDYTGPEASTARNPWAKDKNKPYRANMKSVISSSDTWNPKCIEWGRKYNINPIFLKMVLGIESGGQPGLLEKGGNGKGLFQITPPNIDTPCDASRLLDPEYNMEILSKVVHNEKVRQAKASKSPLTIHEIAWRYNGKSANGKCYADTFGELVDGCKRSRNESIFFTDSPNKNSTNTNEKTEGGSTTIRNSSEAFTHIFKKEEELIETHYPTRHEFKGEGFIAPNGNRREYAMNLFYERKKDMFKNCKKLNEEDYFMSKKCVMRVANEFYPVLNSIVKDLRAESLYQDRIPVVEALNPSLEGSQHSWGGGIKIKSESREHAIRVADVVWRKGLRAVAIGGNFDNEDGFVHFDIGPAGYWQYDGQGVYQGPFSLR